MIRENDPTNLGPFDFLYESSADRNPLAPLGEYHKPPQRFAHSEWTLVAEVPKSGSDGQPVHVFECRFPSRFYKLVAIPDVNSIGKPIAGFSLSTGSGDEMGVLIAQLALAISDGMIGYHANEGGAA